MATEEIIRIEIAGNANAAEAKDIIVRIPFGGEEAVLRIPRAIVRAGPAEEWDAAVAIVRLVGATLSAAQIPAWPSPAPGPRR